MDCLKIAAADNKKQTLPHGAITFFQIALNTCDQLSKNDLNVKIII